MNMFDTLVQDTVKLGNQSYLQKSYNRAENTYSLLYREHGRYSKPVEITHSLENERDADQLLEAAERYGITELLERSGTQ